MVVMVNDKQVAIRVPADTIARAQQVAARLGRLPAYAGLRMTGTTALRLALLRGLDALEAEHGPRRRTP